MASSLNWKVDICRREERCWNTRFLGCAKKLPYLASGQHIGHPRYVFDYNLDVKNSSKKPEASKQALPCIPEEPLLIASTRHDCRTGKR